MPTEEIWTDLKSLGHPKPFAKGKQMMWQGQPGSCVMVIDTGTVKVVRRSADGGRHVIALRGKGDVLGEMSAVSGECRNADVYAITPCWAVVVERGRFLRFVADHKMSQKLYRLEMAKRNAVELEAIEFRTLRSGVRLARQLLRLMEVMGSTELRGVGHDLLAQRVSVTRATLTPNLNRLRHDGVLESTRELIIIKRPDVLRELARFD